MSRNIKWDLDTALTLLKEGKNYREIAERMGLTRGQVYFALRNRGVARKHGPGGPKLSWDFEIAQELLLKGEGVRAIAEEMRLTYGQVYSAMRSRKLRATPSQRSSRLSWDLNRAKELSEEGKSCKEIANMMGLTRKQIYEAFYYRGIVINHKSTDRTWKWNIDAAKELLDQGRDLGAIARIMGVSYSTISSAVKRFGWDIARRKPGPQVTWDIERATELRERGWPWVRIDKELHMPTGTVRGYFERHGLHTPRRQPNMKWDIAEAHRLRQQGLGWKEIGERVGTHGNNVRRALARRGLRITSKRL